MERQSARPAFFIRPHCDCRPYSSEVSRVVVVAAHKIPERCKQATAQAKGGDGFGDARRFRRALRQVVLG